MATLVGGAIAYAFGAAGAGATAFTVAGVAVTYGTIGAVVVAGATVAYSASQSSKLRKSMNASGAFQDQGRSVMLRDPVSPRRKIYGQILTSGLMYAIGVAGTLNEDFHFAVVYAGDEVEEIGELRFNDEVVPLDGGSGGSATGRYAGYVLMGPHHGEPGQAADAAFLSAFPSDWSSAHRGDGIAYDAVRLKYSPDLFPSGPPNVRRMIKGAKCYDPREVSHDPDDSTTWEWTQNAALIAADFLHDSTFGKGVPWSKIDMPALIAAANICDEDVVLDDLSTEKRYTINGTVTADQDTSAVLADLASAMAGTIVDTGGHWTIYAGAYRAPTVSLGDGDLAGPLSVQPRMSRQETYNGVKGVFISPVNEWQLGDFPGVKNDTYMANDGGVRLWKDIALNFTTSSPTAQRLAKIDLERARQQVTFTALFKLSALNVIPGDTISFTRAALGWSSKVFEVVQWELQTYEAGGGNALGVALTLRETAAGVWDWADGEETVDDLAPNTDLPDPRTVPTPTGLTLLTDSSTSINQPDGVFVPRLKVTWNASGNLYVHNGGRYRLEYKKHADATWLLWAEGRGDVLLEYITDVQVAQRYDVRLQFQNQIGVRGTYADSLTAWPIGYFVAGDNAGPSAPTGLAAVTGTGQAVSLDWADNTEGDLSEYGVYRNTVNNFATAAKIAEVRASRFVDVDVTIGTTYYYWVTAFDRSENQSGASSVASATPGAVSGGADTTPPSDPAAPTLSSSGNYVSGGDGTSFAYLVIAMPAMPAGGYIMNLLYRRNGSSGWIVADQRDVGGGTSQIDDLTPGEDYEVAVQAFSYDLAPSNIVAATGSPFTAPINANTPGVPTSLGYIAGNDSNFKRAASYQNGVLCYSVRINWERPSDIDFAFFEYSLSTIAGTPATPFVPTTELEYVLNLTTPIVLYFFVRSVNRSLVRSAWVAGGSTSGYQALPAGNMSEQNESNVNVTGIKTGTGASVRQELAFIPFNVVETLTGGAAEEDVDVDVTSLGLTTKASHVASGLVSNSSDMIVRYDWDDAAQSSTNLRLKIVSRDGSNLPGGAIRITGFAGLY